jgi:hypothetical protein
MIQLRMAMMMALALGAIRAPHAAAEVWGYVDEQGRPHVATEKLDERYQLFFKGRTSADLAVPPPVESDETFKRTAIYQRIVNHPNAKRFEPLIVRYAKQQNVDVALVKAVIAVESAFEPEVVSAKGAVESICTWERVICASCSHCSAGMSHLRSPRTTPVKGSFCITPIKSRRFRKRRNS